jgi:transcriptional regulator with XRE-family HTH domain
MEPTRDEIASWIKEVLAKTGDTPSALARKAGLATTTITRFLNDPGSPMLSLRSMAKIAHVAGVATVPGAPSASPPSVGFAEAEGEPFHVTNADTPVDRAIRALISQRNAADPWILRTRAIEALGYLVGDIVIVDLNCKPISGDAVCAQSYNWEKGQAITIFRIYEPPYLVAATLDTALSAALRKPLLVDNDRVIIKGVITDELRSRAAA